MDAPAEVSEPARKRVCGLELALGVRAARTERDAHCRRGQR